jgi:hypothetical protein
MLLHKNYALKNKFTEAIQTMPEKDINIESYTPPAFHPKA